MRQSEQVYREALIREGAKATQARDFTNLWKHVRIQDALPPMVPLKNGNDPL